MAKRPPFGAIGGVILLAGVIVILVSQVASTMPRPGGAHGGWGYVVASGIGAILCALGLVIVVVGRPTR